jgi:hypothetical protein
VRHATVKFVDDLARNWNLIGVGFELIPQLGNELEFLRRGEPLHFREFLKNHGVSLSKTDLLAME